MNLTPAQRRMLLWIDRSPYHTLMPLRRERVLVARLERMGMLARSRRFGGVTLTSLAHHALGTFKVAA